MMPFIVTVVERSYCKRPNPWFDVFQNIDPPPPSPPGECVPPPLLRGEDLLVGWRVGWGVNILEDAGHSSVLYICKYFVVTVIGLSTDAILWETVQ